MRHVLPIIALLLAACTPTPVNRELRYEAAFDAASTKPPYPVVGAGLRLGMPEAQVRQHLDSLRARDELVWHLSTGPLLVEAEPEFVGGRLARLQLRLGGSGLRNDADYLELVRSLDDYGSESFWHGVGEEDDVQSWFRQGTEVQLVCAPGQGYVLNYIDLHQVPALAVAQQRRDSLQRVEQRQY